MKLNLSGWYNGLITLENRVLDLDRLQIRPKLTEEDIKKEYEGCLNNLDVISEYFEDQEAFEKTRNKLIYERPKFVPKDPKYPTINPFNFKAQKEYQQEAMSIFNPNKTKPGKYFLAACLQIRIPLKDDSPFLKLHDEEAPQEDQKPVETLEEKAIMLIPNDRLYKNAKASIVHESLHYIIVNYQLESKKLITKDEDFISRPKAERKIIESFAQEGIVEYFTDLLLENDKEALFENRWTRYEPNAIHYKLTDLSRSLFTVLALSQGISYPEILPLAPIFYTASTIAKRKIKSSKKEELIKPRERRKFKI